MGCLQARSFAFTLSDFALTAEQAVQTRPMAIRAQIDSFFLRGSWTFHMMAMGNNEQSKSVLIEIPYDSSAEEHESSDS